MREGGKAGKPAAQAASRTPVQHAAYDVVDEVTGKIPGQEWEGKKEVSGKIPELRYHS